MLRLDDVHVQDNESGEWSRPTSSGDVPRQAALYQQVLHCASHRLACDVEQFVLIQKSW